MPTYQELVAQASENGIPYYDLQNLGSGQAFQDALAQRINGQGDPNQSTGGTWGGSTGYSPTLSTTQPGVIDNDYGYFDQGNIQAMNDANNRLQEAFRRGDTAAFQQALDQYRQVTGGLTPVSMQGITPEMVAQNSRNPGGPNAGYQYPQNTPSTPSPNGAPTGFSYGGDSPAVTPPAQLGRASDTTLSPNGPTERPRDSRIPTNIPTASLQGDPSMIATGAANPVADPNGRISQPITGPIPRQQPRIAGTPINGSPSVTPTTSPTGQVPPARIPPSGPIPNTQPPRPGTPITTTTGASPTGPEGPVQATPPRGVRRTTPTGPAAPSAPAAPGVQNPVTASYGAAYQAPAWDPNRGLDPLYYGYEIGAAGNPSLSYIPDLTGNDPNRIFRNVQNVSYNYGAGNSAQIADQQTNQEEKYNQYGNAANDAYNQLAETPGYTGEEAAGITREPQYQSGVTTADQYAQMGPTGAESSGITGDTGSYGDYFNPQNFNDLNQQNQTAQNANVDRTRGAQDTATGGLRNRLGTAESAASVGLRDALANPGLSTTSEYARQAGMTDEEVDQTANAAARNVGLGTQATIEDMNRAAAAAGTTSPLAIGALRARLQQQGQVNAADAVVNARLAAREQQRNAATGVQQTQLGAEQYRTGAGIGAAEYQGSQAASDAQAQAQAELSAAQSSGQLAQNAQNQVAQNQLASEQYITNTGTGIRQAQDAANQARAAQLYGIRQGNTARQQDTTYAQNMGTQNALSANNQTVANQRIAGQGQFRNFLTGQQGQALGAQQTAQGQQLTNYNAMTGALNANAGQWGNYQIGRSSLPAGWQQVAGGIINAATAGSQTSP